MRCSLKKLWSPSTNPYHPDILLFLIIIPFIAGFNYILTYSNIQLNSFLLLTFTIDTVDGYIAVFAFRQLVLYLDKKLPYHKQVFKRIAVQTVAGLFLGVAIIAFLTELVSLIARGKMVPLHFYTHDLPIISIWFFVVSGIYVILFFYKEWRQAVKKREPDKPPEPDSLIIRKGNADIKVPFRDIIGFAVDGDYSVCYDQEGNKYYIEKSLSRLFEELPTQHFYRANRQHIIHREVVSGFKRGANGKLIVLINASMLPTEIPVSRTKASDFKRWLYAQTTDSSSGNP